MLDDNDIRKLIEAQEPIFATKKNLQDIKEDILEFKNEILKGQDEILKKLKTRMTENMIMLIYSFMKLLVILKDILKINPQSVILGKILQLFLQMLFMIFALKQIT